ncbi:hypothetical protein [Streptomyces sp. HC307]|uniref:hypothetical protein n=1 Tax=Streptomyces flavusporus TaxID=3385496 RepID=UPI003916F582
MTWLLVAAVILALGAVVGVEMWDRQRKSEADPTVDAGLSATASTSASPTVSSPSPSPSVVPSVSEVASGAPDEPLSTAEPGPPANPAAANCRPWATTSTAPGVEVRSCARFVGDRLYIIGEWRTTSGSELVNVYLWLEDAAGQVVVYPGPQYPNGMGFHSMPAWPEPQQTPQWREVEVSQGLVHGERYQVCVYVTEEDATPPKISNPETKGIQYGIRYP